MSDSKPIISDLAGLSKPLTKLIETVANGLGVCFEPLRIRRRAKAEAQAVIISARAQAEVTAINARAEADALAVATKAEADAAVIAAKNAEELRKLELRAEERIRKLEDRRQRNIEAIVQKAAEELPGSVSTNPVEEDWVVNFFEQCKDIKDEEMQTLWARLLAGEIADPGSFSPRTLALVKVLRKADAHLFTKYCTFVWRQGGRAPVRFVTILNAGVENLRAETLTQMELFHLHSLGLIQYNHITSFNFGGTPGTVALIYGPVCHVITLTKERPNFDVGHSILTDIGQELAAVAGPTPNETYRQAVVAWLREIGLAVHETPSSL
jgi:uncharacterized repeat protein (TIGR03899 family)